MPQNSRKATVVVVNEQMSDDEGNMSQENCDQNSPNKVEEEEEERKQPKVNFVKKNEERLREMQE